MEKYNILNYFTGGPDDACVMNSLIYFTVDLSKWNHFCEVCEREKIIEEIKMIFLSE